MTTPPSYRKVNPSDTPVLLLTLKSETLPLPTINEYVEINLVQRVSTLPGVAQVMTYGSQKYAIRVQVDPDLLAIRGIGLLASDRPMASVFSVRIETVCTTETDANAAVNSIELSIVRFI